MWPTRPFSTRGSIRRMPDRALSAALLGLEFIAFGTYISIVSTAMKPAPPAAPISTPSSGPWSARLRVSQLPSLFLARR